MDGGRRSPMESLRREALPILYRELVGTTRRPKVRSNRRGGHKSKLSLCPLSPSPDELGAHPGVQKPTTTPANTPKKRSYGPPNTKRRWMYNRKPISFGTTATTAQDQSRITTISEPRLGRLGSSPGERKGHCSIRSPNPVPTETWMINGAVGHERDFQQGNNWTENQ